MDEPGGRQRRSQGEPDADGTSVSRRPADGDGETIQFGGLPIKWPYSPVERFPRSHAYLLRAAHVARAPAGKGALIAVAIALLIGFGVGRFTAPTSSKAAKSPSGHLILTIPILHPQWASSAIQPTGAECAMQIGKNLQLGIEIKNTSNLALTLGPITPQFPLGGLRTISAGMGVCGELIKPSLRLWPQPPFQPGASQWITVTVAVEVGCPQAFPVWFKVGYSAAGKSAAIVIRGFPDLASVPYRNCPTAGTSRLQVPNADVVDTSPRSPYSG